MVFGTRQAVIVVLGTSGFFGRRQAAGKFWGFWNRTVKDQAHLVPQRPRRNLTKAEFWRFGAYVRSTNNTHSDPVPSETYSIVKRHFETMILVPLHRRIYRKSRRNTWNLWNGSLQTWFRGISSSVSPQKIKFLKSTEISPEKLCFWYFSAHYNHFWI